MYNINQFDFNIKIQITYTYISSVTSKLSFPHYYVKHQCENVSAARLNAKFYKLLRRVTLCLKGVYPMVT